MSAENVNAWWWMQSASNRSHLSKFPENWEDIGNFAFFGPCGGLIGEQFQKFAGKIPVQGNWEFILRKWETQNGAAAVFGTTNAQNPQPCRNGKAPYCWAHVEAIKEPQQGFGIMHLVAVIRRPTQEGVCVG